MIGETNPYQPPESGVEATTPALPRSWPFTVAAILCYLWSVGFALASGLIVVVVVRLSLAKGWREVGEFLMTRYGVGFACPFLTSLLFFRAGRALRRRQVWRGLIQAALAFGLGYVFHYICLRPR